MKDMNIVSIRVTHWRSRMRPVCGAILTELIPLSPVSPSSNAPLTSSVAVTHCRSRTRPVCGAILTDLIPLSPVSLSSNSFHQTYSVPFDQIELLTPVIDPDGHLVMHSRTPRCVRYASPGSHHPKHPPHRLLLIHWKLHKTRADGSSPATSGAVKQNLCTVSCHTPGFRGRQLLSRPPTCRRLFIRHTGRPSLHEHASYIALGYLVCYAGASVDSMRALVN